MDNIDREASVNEFKSQVVDPRQRSTDPSQIDNEFRYLEASQSYKCRTHVSYCVQIVECYCRPCSCSGLCAVPSFVHHSNIVPNGLLTVKCLEKLKTNLPIGHQFLAYNAILRLVSAVLPVERFILVCYVSILRIIVDKSKSGRLVCQVNQFVMGVLVLPLLLIWFLRLKFLKLDKLFLAHHLKHDKWEKKFNAKEKFVDVDFDLNFMD